MTRDQLFAEITRCQVALVRLTQEASVTRKLLASLRADVERGDVSVLPRILELQTDYERIQAERCMLIDDISDYRGRLSRAA